MYRGLEDCFLDGALQCFNTEETCALFQQLRRGRLQSGQALQEGFGEPSSPHLQKVSQRSLGQDAVPGYGVFEKHRATRLFIEKHLFMLYPYHGATACSDLQHVLVDGLP